MDKVKLFYSRDDVKKVGKEINDWLRENKKNTVIDRKISTAGTSTCHHITVMITYKK